MKNRTSFAVLVGLSVFAIVDATAKTGFSASPAMVGRIEFQHDIRPIFSDTCYTCHGPDRANRKTELRLDSRAGASVDLGGYKAIVPGQPDKSPLYQRITSDDPDERMPPPNSHRHLTPRQIELIGRWIKEGAVWQAHWSLVAPKRPPLPAVRQAGWVRNGIDNFVLAKLEQAGLEPSAEASKETLIRRVTLDLTGLPPTLAEVDDFLADHSPNAYEKVVDRLLASPRYGEHMAAEWLDAARYSDTNGYQADGTRTMWPWRDWVVTAMNDNMPFDQFTIEQLAGDLLPGATLSQKLATGFNRNHPLNGEGGRIPEESRVEYVVDRVDTTSTVWMGLTVGCARCHDHKYDPIAQREFYQMFAFFNNISETGGVDHGGNAKPVMNWRAPSLRLEQIQTQIARLEKKLMADTPELTSAQIEWQAALTHLDLAVSRMSPWRVLGPFTAGTFDATFKKNFGPEGTEKPAEEYEGIRWQPRQQYVDGQVTPLHLPPASAVYLARTIVVPRAVTLSLSVGSDDAIKLWLDGRLILSHEVHRSAAQDQEQLRIELMPGENRLLMKIANAAGPAGFYFEISAAGPTREIGDALRRPLKERTTADQELIKRYFRSVAPELAPLNAKLAGLRRQQAEEIKKISVSTMVMDERLVPRETYVLYRGQYDKPDKNQQVTPGVPACLPPLPAGAPRNRLSLARWLVDPSNPLTARVTVNRYWQHFFGMGIVKTLEDFGSQGEPPTHPQLLDYLATEFIAHHWDVKAMHRLLVTSATYRQSSRATPELLDRDPYDRLLSRGPRFRLSSFALRDQALALSGLLVEKIGGPPVKPYQPAGVWSDFSLGKIHYVQDHGENLYRRSLYIFWRRSVGPTMLFDAASRQVCTVSQARTDSPLHALTLLNDVTYVEAARLLAERIMKEGGPDSAARIARAFRMATARQPLPAERDVLVAGLERARRHFQAHPQAAKALLATGEWPRDPKLNPVELAAYTSMMSVILNLDEVQTKE